MAPIYGQVVAGPPGSGKTTYCTGMEEYLHLLGRKAFVINLDPANEVPKNLVGKKGTEDEEKGIEDEGNSHSLPYDALLDVCDTIVNLSSVMKQLGLGPNGGLVYCMEYLEAHVDQLVEMIRERVEEHDNPYLIFDLPGQVELYSHSNTVPRLLEKLVKVLDLRLVAVQLIDSHYCTEPANFLSAALLGTTLMLRLELPTVSVLSKVDLLTNYGPLPFSLDYFTDCLELDRLLPFLQPGGDFQQQDDLGTIGSNEENNYADDPDYQAARRKTRMSPFFRKHEKMHKVLAEVVGEFGLLSFLPLDISDAGSVGRVLAKIDKCNGYSFVDHGSSKTQDLFQCAVQSEYASDYEAIADIEERLAASRDIQQPQQQQEQEPSNRIDTIFETEQHT
jgi:GTPase SAR1 family protein